MIILNFTKKKLELILIGKVKKKKKEVKVKVLLKVIGNKKDKIIKNRIVILKRLSIDCKKN